ncbi:MAG: PHB depolymerase family esterase [Pseudomonadota bacterium]
MFPARLPALALSCLMALGALTPAHACGTAEDDLCETANGAYRISQPAEHKRGAMIWLHGWGGSANGAMKNTGFRDRLAARGMAYVALDGRITSDRYKNKNWAVNDGRNYERNDVAFVAEVVEDLVARHGIDRDRILLAGFSRGGSMVWDVACRAPDVVRAYAPVAGAFWEPMWDSCEGPVDLFHTHGWTDRTVPLEGRPLGGGVMTQGDVFQSLYILRESNGCGNRQPESGPVDGDRWTRIWSDCEAGRIDFTLHPGGHSIPRGWLDQTLDWFEARMAES